MIINNRLDTKIIIRCMLYSCFIYIILRLFWGWLADKEGIYSRLYTFSVLVFFGIVLIGAMIAVFRGCKIRWYLFFQLLCTAIGFLMLFLSYQYFFDSPSHSNFFGIPCEGHAVFLLNFSVLLVPGLLFCNYFHPGEYKRTFYFLIAAVIIINFLFTVRAVVVFPNALRARATATHLGFEGVLFGTPTYSIVYGMAICFPLFLEKLKQSRGKNRLIVLGLIVILVFTILASQFATATIAMFFGGFIYLVLASSSNKKVLYILLGSLLMVLFFFTDVGADLLYRLASMVNQDGTWASKLIDLGDSLSASEMTGSVAVRGSLYKESFAAFLNNPVLGNLSGNVYTIGGHATFFDILGLTGLVGAIPFNLMIWFSYMNTKKGLKNKSLYSVLRACYAGFLIIFIFKNTISAFCIYAAIFLLVPFVLKYFDKEGCKQDELIEEDCISACDTDSGKI